MPRPKKDIQLAGISVEKNEDRNTGPLKLVLRLPVPKETDVSLSSDLGAGSEEILQSDDDESLTNDDLAMIRETGTPSLMGTTPFLSGDPSNSSRKKRRKKKFKLTMPTQKTPGRKPKKVEAELSEKETKKFKKNIIDTAVEREIETEESSDIKSPSPIIPDYSPLQFLLDNLLKSFEKKDPDNFFMQPVTDEIAPNYSTMITNPMDFSTMRRKMESNEYKNLPEFKSDIELIAKNALIYNEHGSIYHIAAKKLMNIADYLFSKEKLLFLQKTCNFMTKLNEYDLGIDLSKPLVVKQSKPPLAKYACIVDDMSADEVLAQVSVAAQAMATRLASRKPNCRTAYISSKPDGTATLKMLIPEKILDVTTERKFCLNDVVPKLKEGNPGMTSFKENSANLVVPYNYLDYGSFASFAPLYDSTWSTLSKDDSDLLLATYGGDETCAQYVESIKNYVDDCGDDLVKMVDGMLDALTDGEHSKSMKKIFNKNSGAEELFESNSANQSQEVESSSEIDFSFLDNEIQSVAVETKLAEASALLCELRNVQYERLSQQPPFVLTETPGPSLAETNIAHQLLTNLQCLTAQVEPGQLASTDVVRTFMGAGQSDSVDQTTDSNGSDDYDMNVFREFFHVDNNGS